MRDAEQPHRAHRAAEARMDAQHHLGQAERDLRIVGRDAMPAGEREFEPAAEAIAVDRRDGGAGQVLEPLQHGVRRADGRHGLVRPADLAELRDVGAGDEAALGGDDHEARGAGLCDCGEPLVEFFHGRA